MRRILGVLACVLFACGSPMSRGVRVEFFPGPTDERLQLASYDAVVGVLQRRGAQITDATPPFDLRALMPLECAGQRRVAALRFTRTAGPQSISIRVCRAESASQPCSEEAPEDRPITDCGRSTNALLGTMEADLADYLLTRAEPARYDTRRWWEASWPWSLLPLVSLRDWGMPAEVERWNTARSTSFAVPGTSRWTSRSSTALVDSTRTGASRSVAMERPRPARSGAVAR